MTSHLRPEHDGPDERLRRATRAVARSVAELPSDRWRPRLRLHVDDAVLATVPARPAPVFAPPPWAADVAEPGLDDPVVELEIELPRPTDDGSTWDAVELPLPGLVPGDRAVTLPGRLARPVRGSARTLHLWRHASPRSRGPRRMVA